MTVGDISTLLVWGAMTAFTVGFLAYTADLARIAEAASRASRLPVGEREPVEVGAALSGAAATRPAATAGVGGTGAAPVARGSRRAAGISLSLIHI